jgi:hypothetical protein
MEFIKINDNFYNIIVSGKCAGTMHRDDNLWLLNIPEYGIVRKSQYRNDLKEDAKQILMVKNAYNRFI